jgi:hypothetical protein
MCPTYPQAAMISRTSAESYALSKHRLRCSPGSRSDGMIGWASKVTSNSFTSCRFAPAIVSAIGTPLPSVNTLRLVPDLPRSVGFAPVSFSPQWRFHHRPIHRHPFPLNPNLLGVPFQSQFPHPQKHPLLNPQLEAIMDCTRCT